MLVTAASAGAGPAYAPSTVNLRPARAQAMRSSARFPGGSLVDASNCTDWCEVDWQGKKGFVIATALDRRARPASRPAARSASPPRGRYRCRHRRGDDYVPVGPPVVYGARPLLLRLPAIVRIGGYGCALSIRLPARLLALVTLSCAATILRMRGVVA